MIAKYEPEIRWHLVYRMGGIAAILAVLVGVAEIVIQFIPGAGTIPDSSVGWFTLYQNNAFLGLRNMGLLNILLNLTGIFTYFALLAAHRRTQQYPFAALALIISYIGIAVFLATSRALAMWALSQQYQLAATPAYQAQLEAAAQSILVVGGSHSPGTYPAFFLQEIAGILISLVMIRSEIFGKAAGICGAVGFAALLIFESITSFSAGLTSATMLVSMVGGILTLIWYVLIARTFFTMGKQNINI
jgi:hypothetical protein